MARKTWILGLSAPSTAAPARSTSNGWARARAAITGRRISLTMERTPSKSSSEATGNPASMTSTPSLSSWAAILSFSAVDIVAPGDCSAIPQRRIENRDLGHDMPILLRVLYQIKTGPSLLRGPARRRVQSRAVRLYCVQRPMPSPQWSKLRKSKDSESGEDSEHGRRVLY